MQIIEKQAYVAYLESTAWANKRQEYRDAGMPTTCFCGARDIDLHHRTYSRLGRERLSDLVPLCRPHHELAHSLVNLKRCTLKDAHKHAERHWREGIKTKVTPFKRFEIRESAPVTVRQADPDELAALRKEARWRRKKRRTSVPYPR